MLYLILEKEAIKNYLISNRNVVTVTPEIVDPDYVYIRVVAKVFYNPNLTTRTEGELSDLVDAAIYDYNDMELNRFGAVFRKSKLQNYIEAADKSITGSEVSIYVQKRIILDLNTQRKYDVYYNMPIAKGNYKDRLYSFPEIQVADIEGIERNVLFEEQFDLLTGVKSVNVVEPGTGYTAAPTVTIIGDGVGATAKATVSAGRVINITVTNPGVGYTFAEIVLSDTSGSGAVFTPILDINYGTLRSFYYKDTGGESDNQLECWIYKLQHRLLNSFIFLYTRTCK
jgi:acetyltransferase-like isoleucine patch superfamily enzyme